MSDTQANPSSRTRKSREQLRVGFLAQENFAVPAPFPGASVSRVVYELASRLGEQLDVTVCSLEHPDVPEGVQAGIRYLRVPHGLDDRRHSRYRHAIRVLRRLDLPHRELQGWSRYSRGYATVGLKRLAEHEPDIVHLQNVSQLLPLARTINRDASLVLHMHCPWLVELPPRLVLPRLRNASLVLGVSEFIVDPVRNAFPEIADRCHCLHNGVNPDSFPPRSSLPEDVRYAARAMRAEWNALDDPVILYVGSFAPVKGTLVLLDAFEQLLERIPTAKLVLVGGHARYFQVSSPSSRHERRARRQLDRSYPFEVEAKARSLGSRVTVQGRIPHAALVAFYAAADVLAMPSTGPEAFPLPVLEAFASELPVVASRAGGLPEIVQDGVNGRLVPPGDATALSDALIELCESRDVSRRLGVTGRRLVMDRFTWSRQAQRLAGLYETAAKCR